ncbi:NAD(P)/FAD-dependent oxidoreductase [Bacteroidota bacterium]
MKSNNSQSRKSFYDVIIVGGGIMGSSIAYFLANNKNFKGSILVIEKSPAHFESSTALSVGGIRQQFSTPENIEISRFGASFIKDAAQYLTVDGDVPYLPFVENGYLFLATKKGEKTLKENYLLQKKHAVDVEYLSPQKLKIKFPWLNVDDLSSGCFGMKNEGWTDPYALLKAFIRKSKSIGVTFLKNEVISIKHNSKKINTVELDSGMKYSCGTLINAAGPRAAEISAMIDIKLPVRSKKRYVYTFVCKDIIENCPFVIDPTGVYFRPEGNKYLCGVSPPEDNDPDTYDLDVKYYLFDEIIWPVLASRVDYFEAIRRDHSWAGHYAYNTFDQNAILGFHPEIKNFIFANGFSGHGLQQAPAVGRAISELIIYGSYQSLDLSKLNYERIKTGKPVKERNIV